MISRWVSWAVPACLVACTSVVPSAFEQRVGDEPAVFVKRVRIPPSEPWYSRFASHCWFEVREADGGAWRRVEVVAHRGYSAAAPENTVAALSLALDVLTSTSRGELELESVDASAVPLIVAPTRTSATSSSTSMRARSATPGHSRRP